MKKSQLETLQRYHKVYLGTPIEAPKAEKYIKLGLVSGETMKLRPAAEIMKAARERMVNDRYDATSLPLASIFATCPSYEAAKKAWHKEEEARLKKVAAYRKVADPLMERAELDADHQLDPTEVAAELREAARQAGLLG